MSDQIATESQKSYRCRHILTAGRRCRSAALRAENFCYYHQTTRDPSPEFRGCNPLHAECLLPSLEDRASIQHALSQILNRISTNQLDEKRARLLLYGLQIAAYLLPKEPRAQPSREEEEPEPAVEDFTLDPKLGPLAPIAELVPKVREKGFAQLLLEEMKARQDAERQKREPLEEAEPEESQEEETIPTIQAVADYQLPTNHYQLHHHPLKPIARTTPNPNQSHSYAKQGGGGTTYRERTQGQ